MGLRHWGGSLASKLARPTPVPQNHSSLRSGSLDMTIFLKIFSSCLTHECVYQPRTIIPSGTFLY